VVADRWIQTLSLAVANAIRSPHRSGAKYTSGARCKQKTSGCCADRAGCLFRRSIRICSSSLEITLWQTRDRGRSLEKISPDLSRPNYELPASIGKYKEDATKQAHRRGVIYTLRVTLDTNRIWCGTDDGLIHLTTDGGKT